MTKIKMMFLLLSLLNICTGVSFSQNGTLVVPENGAIKIGGDGYNPQILDALIMKDNSTIIVTGGPNFTWSLQVAKVIIGKNCVINVRGTNGRNGADSRYVPHVANYCENGKDENAKKGGDGTPGIKGPDIKFVWGIETIGELRIERHGGKGGDGGKGGTGQKGGQARCWCSAGNGGKGGTGGKAGRGGDTSNVSIIWYPLNKSFKPKSTNPGLVIVGEPGEPGIPGKGGDQGGWGDGVGCPIGSRGHGNNGWHGDVGSPNTKGTAGKKEIKRFERIEFPTHIQPLFATEK